MHRISVVAVLAALLAVPTLVAQEAHIIHGIQNAMPYRLDTGSIPNASPITSVVDSRVVSIPGAASMRLIFDEINLGPNDYIELRSVYDGHEFRMTRTEANKWQNTSPYFNGAHVEVRLVLAPWSQGSYAIRQVLTGATGAAIDTICGSTDDRVTDTDFRSMRFVSSATASGGGCTIWVVSEDDCMITAGHCLGGSLAVAETMTPQSLSNGQLQHPSPRYQWTVDFTGSQSVDGGIGNDWGFVRLNPNNMGERAASLVGWYDIGYDIPAPGTPTRITGYGSASGTRNQTLKTHVGPFAASASGTRLRYQTDTTGGNSGSPVIDDSTGRAIGIHTHGGCNSSGGSNSGTSLTLSTFRSAFEAFCPPMDLTVTSASGDLRVAIDDLPTATQQLLTLWSFDTSSPVGQGALFGLEADSFTLSILGLPATPGNLINTVAPFAPGLWPSVDFTLPAGSLASLAGQTVDSVAVAIGPGFTLEANSAVERTSL